MVNMKFVNKIIAFALVVSLFAMAFSFEGKAAEMVDYPTSFISVECAISENGGPYVNTDFSESTSFITRFLFTFGSKSSLDKIAGNSEISFDITYLCEGADFTSLEIYGVHVFDENFNRVASVSVFDKALSLTYRNPRCYDFKIDSLSLGLNRDITIKYIQVYFKQVTTNGEVVVSADSYNLSYYTPDLMHDIVNPSPDDQNKVDDFENDFEDKTSEMDSLVGEMGNLEKPDIDNIYPDVEEYLPEDEFGYLGKIFNCVYVFGLPVTMLTLVFIFGMIGYVLFGKKK